MRFVSRLELLARVQIFVEAACISLSANAFAKGMYLSVLSSWLDKQSRRRKTLNSKPATFLCYILLVTEGLGKYFLG